MKKEQFRTMVKEIIKEVIEEMSVTTTPEENNMPVQEKEVPDIGGKAHSQYPKDTAPRKNLTGGSTSDQKIASRNAAWSRYNDKMKMLHQIKNEPEMKKKLGGLKGAHERGDQLDADRAATNPA